MLHPYNNTPTTAEKKKRVAVATRFFFKSLGVLGRLIFIF